jgi:hypothetical protein
MSIDHGVGRHIFYLEPLEAMTAAKYNVIAQPLNVWALFFVKASIMMYILRLRPGKIYEMILWGTLGLLLAITIELFVITMAQCQPLKREWGETTEGFCWSPNIFTYSTYVLSGTYEVVRQFRRLANRHQESRSLPTWCTLSFLFSSSGKFSSRSLSSLVCWVSWPSVPCKLVPSSASRAHADMRNNSSGACTIATIPFIGALAATADVTFEIVNLASLKT